MLRRLTFALAPLVLLTACGPGPATPASGVGGAPPQEIGRPVAALSAEDKATLATLPIAFQHADPANGELHFSLCRSCHSITKGGPDVVGPNLYGVVGRKAASRPDYDYSSGLKATGWTWDADHLDVWLKNPRAAVAGTKMSFYGLRDDADRRDVIAYLAIAGAR